MSVGTAVLVDEDGNDSNTRGAGDEGGVMFGMVGGEVSGSSKSDTS